jgi:hypothetical protein
VAFLLKRQDGRDIAKKRYCPVQNETYGQPTTTQRQHKKPAKGTVWCTDNSEAEIITNWSSFMNNRTQKIYSLNCQNLNENSFSFKNFSEGMIH